VTRVNWKPTTKWAYAYPWELPAGGGDVTGVGVDSKDNVWVWQRNQPGSPALFKFGPDYKMLFAVPAELTDHSQPFRGHGMGVDPDGNAWVLNEWGAFVEVFSPEGKLIRTVGTKGKRGDWDESKEQRLLWEPVTIGFGPNGDAYIFEGHGDESPNDIASDDPANQIGVARVIHLDKNGKFINQWFGNNRGPGKFNSTHGSAVDPATGDVWVGDREDYRIVVFTANGHYLRTIQVRNLVCALYFDNHPGPRFGTLWFATGMDGQVVRIDRDGNVLEVAGGNRKGGGEGQFNEATNMSSDSKGNLVVADTQAPRATMLIPPGNPVPVKK
jgi:DNA-binding beta-propeller fold protein YncE